MAAPSRFSRGKLLQWRFPEGKVVHLPVFVDTDRLTHRFEHDGHCLYLGRAARDKVARTYGKKGYMDRMVERYRQLGGT